MSLAYRCALCDADNPRWSIVRQGDVVQTWACSEHLELVITDLIPAMEHRDVVILTDRHNVWRDVRTVT